MAARRKYKNALTFCEQADGGYISPAVNDEDGANEHRT